MTVTEGEKDFTVGSMLGGQREGCSALPVGLEIKRRKEHEDDASPATAMNERKVQVKILKKNVKEENLREMLLLQQL